MDDFSKLQAEGEQQRYRFLTTDIEFCGTLVSLAETEHGIGHPAAAERCLADAEKGYEMIAQVLADSTHTLSHDQRQSLEHGLGELRKALDRVELRLGPDAAAA